MTPPIEAEAPSTENGLGAIEAPRYSCALGGAYATAVGIFGVVPILHSGAGCGIGQLFGQLYAGGQNAGGPQGGTSSPCSGLVEHHVVFGGEDKLRHLISSTIEVMDGDIYAVITGCVPSLIGDDVNAVVREFKDTADVIHVKTSGFNGTSYDGYELFFDAVIEDLLVPLPKEDKTVNIFGVVPYQHIFWKGDTRAIKQLLARIGVKARVFAAEFDGAAQLKQIPSASLNVVLSTWNGIKTAGKLKEKFDQPYLAFPSVPIGPKQTAAFLRTIGKHFKVPSDLVESVIKEEEQRAYRFIEYGGDALVLVRPHAYFSVVADSGTAIGVSRFLINELGYLPDLIQVTDNPPEEVRDDIVRALSTGLETPVVPEIRFESDSHLIKENLKGRSALFLFASSLEAPTALADFGLGANPVTISFPAYNRLILNRSLAGYEGGLSLMEELISSFVGPL